MPVFGDDFNHEAFTLIRNVRKKRFAHAMSSVVFAYASEASRAELSFTREIN